MEAIKDMGFDRLLEFMCIQIRRKLCQFLVDSFNPTTLAMSINGKIVIIFPMDVKYIFGVQAEGIDVTIGSKDKTKILFKEHFGDIQKLSMNTLPNK